MTKTLYCIAACMILWPAATGCGYVFEDSPAAKSKRPEIDDRAQVELPKAEPLQISLVSSQIQNGQLSVFDIVTDKNVASIRELTGKLGAYEVSPAKWSNDGKRWKVLATLPVSFQKKEVGLNLKGMFEDGVAFSLERNFSVHRLEYPKENLEVPKKYMALPDKTKVRVRKERASMKKALATKIPFRLWRGSFVRPTKSEETSVFGVLRLYNNQKESRHMGWDLDGVTGDPILSTQRGRVILNEDRFYSGLTLVIHHGYGLVSMYFHLSETRVSEGELVEAGQLIGLMGESGRVTGPHLHFAAKLHNIYVDPKSIVAMSFEKDPLL